MLNECGGPSAAKRAGSSTAEKSADLANVMEKVQELLEVVSKQRDTIEELTEAAVENAKAYSYLKQQQTVHLLKSRDLLLMLRELVCFRDPIRRTR